MDERFITFELEKLVLGVPLPVTLFIYLDFRFITFRAAGDLLDQATYDRLQFKKVRYLFVSEADLLALEHWAAEQANVVRGVAPPTPDMVELDQVRTETRRKMLDIFQEEHPDRLVSQAIDASRKIVDAIMKFPLTVKPLSQLQAYSQGTVDHSVNVSILSVYLAIQMGYSHTLILQHVALGGLLHDVGKAKVPVVDTDKPEEVERKMREHPALGVQLFEGQAKLSNEVKMIIAQHHEFHDGSGYPKGLRGNNIYDLARIVVIANAFDDCVKQSKGPLDRRQRGAIRQLDETQFKKFDPQKLEKALKVLKMGI